MDKITKCKREITKVVSLKCFYSRTRDQFKKYKSWLSMSNTEKQNNWDMSSQFVDFGRGILGYYTDSIGVLSGKDGAGYYLRVSTPAGNSVDYRIK